MIIPDFLVLIGTIATIFYKTVSWNCYFSLECPLISALLGGLIISVFFGFIFYVSKGNGLVVVMLSWVFGWVCW